MILAVVPLTIPLDFDRSARKREDILLGLISEDPTGGLRDDERDKLPWPFSPTALGIKLQKPLDGLSSCLPLSTMYFTTTVWSICL